MFDGDPFTTLATSGGLKKWISATAVADYGDSQALVAPAVGRGASATAFEIGSARLVNRSGSPSLVGLGVRYDITTWVAGQVTSAGDYTAATTAAQDATADDFSLWQNAITTGNGFLVGATEKWNVLAVIQSDAGDQTTPVLLL